MKVRRYGIKAHLIALSLAGAAAGCGGDESTATSRTCGSGTVEQSGQCIAESVATECGAGTKLEGAQCLPDGVGEPSGLECGTGTKESEGQCVLDPAGVPVEITCGAGTIEKNGACVVDPSSVSGLVCGAGTVEESGACVRVKGLIDDFKITRLDVIAPAGGKLLVNYPVTVEVAYTAKSSFQGTLLSLMTTGTDEAPAAGESTFTCLLGGLNVTHSGDGSEMVVRETFVVSPLCLHGNEDVPAPTGDFKMSPALMFNPDLELTDGKDIHTFGPGTTASGCTSNEGAGDCTYEFGVSEAPGVDVKLDEIRATSSVVVLKTVPDSVVKTSQGDLIYGAPDITINAAVIAYGTAVVDENGDPLNVLGEDAMTVTYDIRPSSAADGDSWQPIFLHQEGDPAKAGEDVVIDPLNQAVEPEVVAQAPVYLTHTLYIEDHCGTRCNSPICPNHDTCAVDGYCVLDPSKGLDPDDGGCDASQAARTAMTTGAWKDETKFTIRACISAGAEAGSELTFAENNCAYEEIYVTRVDNDIPAGKQGDHVDPTLNPPEMPADPSGGSAYIMGVPQYAVGYTWANSVGGGFMSLDYGLRTDGGANPWGQGLAGEVEGWVAGNSDQLGYFEIIRGWQRGLSANSGHGYAYETGLRVFDIMLLSDYKESFAHPAAITSVASPSFAKSKEKYFGFMLGPLRLGVTTSITGTLGLDYRSVHEAATQGGAAVLLVSANPFATLSLNGNAGVDIWVASAGMSSNLTLISGSVGGTIHSDANGWTGNQRVAMSASLTTLSGSVGLYATYPGWECGTWYCYPTTARYDYTLASWGGYSWYFPIYSWHMWWW